MFFDCRCFVVVVIRIFIYILIILFIMIKRNKQQQQQKNFDSIDKRNAIPKESEMYRNIYCFSHMHWCLIYEVPCNFFLFVRSFLPELSFFFSLVASEFFIESLKMLLYTRYIYEWVIWTCRNSVCRCFFEFECELHYFAFLLLNCLKMNRWVEF